MTIENNKGHISLECNACPRTEENDTGEEWGDFWNRMKIEGWKARKIKGDGTKGIREYEWIHQCPRCAA